MGSLSRLEKIRQLLIRLNMDGVVLTLQKNVSWLIGGRTHVNLASELACCHVFVTAEECLLAVNNIEAKRILEEECTTDELFTSVDIWEWYETAPLMEEWMNSSACGVRVVCDTELESELLLLRTVMEDDQLVELRELGKLTAEAIEHAACRIKRGDTEFQIAGRLAAACYERELEPVVNLIAADERTRLRRHPLPTGKELERYAMMVVCARRNGLIASATRLVHFGPIPEEIAGKMNAVIEIDARMMHASVPGKPLETIFREIKGFYADAGYPDEYKRHHQGGLTGYRTREKLVTLNDKTVIQAKQLYAWNPTIAGVKSEDTIFVHADRNEVITADGHFPCKEIKIGTAVYKRPWILQRDTH